MSIYSALNRIFGVVQKEFALYSRDTSIMRLILIMPLMQIIVFGYVLNTIPKHLPTVWIDHDKTGFTRSLLRGLHYTEYFDFVQNITTQEQAQQAMKLGKISIIITIPENWTANFLKNQQNPVAFEIDATDPITSSQASYAMEVIIKKMRSELAAYNTSNRAASTYDTAVHRAYNGQLITKYGLIPPLIGIILTTTLINLTAISVVNEREQGTMEMLLTTPVKPLEILIGKLIPNIIVGYAQVLVIVAISIFLLRIPFKGSMIGFLMVSFPYIVTNLSLGLLFSVTAKSQLEATTASIMVLLPSILLSGTIFPIHGMPLWARAISTMIPATYYTQICRSVFLKGSSIVGLWPNVWPLIVLMLISIYAATRYFKVRLD